MKPVFTDHSILYRPYLGIMALGYLALAAYAGWTWHHALALGRLPNVADMGLQIAIFFFLLNYILMRTEYRLEEKEIVMVKKGILSRKEVRLSYDQIDGVHHFKNQLMKPMTYRYSFRMYAALDNRPIWALIYNINENSSKVGRVLMKGSEAFWQAFEDRLPGKIRVTQEEVIANTYKHMEKVLRSQGYFQGQKEMDVKEGVEQLRHSGEEAPEETPSSDEKDTKENK